MRNTIVRKFKETTTPFLRVQLGVNELRPILLPRYESKTLVGHIKGNVMVGTFKLLAWGETDAEAESMLHRNYPPEPAPAQFVAATPETIVIAELNRDGVRELHHASAGAAQCGTMKARIGLNA